MNQQKKEKKWAHEVSLAVDSGLVYVECRTKLILVLDYRSLTRLLNTVGDIRLGGNQEKNDPFII